MSLVLDASATLNFVMPDEFASGTVDLLEMIRRVGSWVPSLWRLEIANSLSVAVRRRRITRDFRDDTLDDLSLLDIRVDDRTDSAAWGAVLTLADRHGLSVYDAAYLELAQRRRLPLATLDARLSQAAAVEAVPLVFA